MISGRSSVRSGTELHRIYLNLYPAAIIITAMDFTQEELQARSKS